MLGSGVIIIVLSFHKYPLSAGPGPGARFMKLMDKWEIQEKIKTNQQIKKYCQILINAIQSILKGDVIQGDGVAILNQVLFVEVTVVLKKKRKKKKASPARPGGVEREVVRIVGAESLRWA